MQGRGRIRFAGMVGTSYPIAMRESADGVPARPALKLGTAEWGLIGLHSLLWGSAYFFAELAIRELPPLTITAFRLIPAVLVTTAVCIALGYRLPATRAEWGRFVVLALFNNMAPMLLILWAQREVTGGLAAVLNATTPLFGVFLAHVVTTDEKLSARKLAGILTGIAGVAVLVGFNPETVGQSGILARLALLAAAFCYAVSGLYARRFPYSPYVMSSGQMIGALTLSMPLALLIDQPWTLSLPSLTAVGAVAGMGLFASALASLCYFTVIKRAGATNAMLVTLLLPLTPIVLGGAFLGEVLTIEEAVGALVIGLALLIIDGRFIGWITRT